MKKRVEHHVKLIGRALVPSTTATSRAFDGLPQGTVLRIHILKPRRKKAHRLFFATIAAACKIWPEHTEPNPDGDPEHLRAWLLCKAGACEWIDFPVEATNAVNNLLARIKADDKYPFVKTVTTKEGPMLRVYTALSMSEEAMDEDDFAPVRRRCFDTIQAITGVSVEDFRRAALGDHYGEQEEAGYAI